MAVIRKVEIRNFRSIKHLDWYPQVGFNCLIGFGDSGKSSVLDAIDFCLSARRNLPITDADFHNLDVDEDISITLVLGFLNESLKNYEKYGDFICGMANDGTITDEPGHGLEHVLVLNLKIQGDLDPKWQLLSSRAEQKGLERGLNWGDRQALSPTRLGAWSENHLTWRKGSVLNRLSDEEADPSAALSDAARQARKSFGDEADKQLSDALKLVNKAAKELGVPLGKSAKAMLDNHSVSIKGGTIALHNESGIPLRGLGLGSTRLLIAGLQREVASDTSIVLVDEIEHGLEPHRIIRLIGSLGAKETPAPQQVFATSHAPTVLRELDHTQLVVLRQSADEKTRPLVPVNDTQGTLRAFPEAFLAPSVLICEGASEIGFIRGFDRYTSERGNQSLFAAGTALVDCGGGDPSRPYRRGKAFRDLWYRVAVFRDDDVQPDPMVAGSFHNIGGETIKWDHGQDIETAIIMNVSNALLLKLLDYAVSSHGVQLVNSHLTSASQGLLNEAGLRGLLMVPNQQLSADQLGWIAKAAGGKNGWFKSIRYMEHIAYDILAPNWVELSNHFQTKINALLNWVQTSHG